MIHFAEALPPLALLGAGYLTGFLVGAVCGVLVMLHWREP